MAKTITQKLAGLFAAKAQASAELANDLAGLDAEIIAARNALARTDRIPVLPEVIERRVKAFLLGEETKARRFFHPGTATLPDGSAAQMGLASVLQSNSQIGQSLIGGLSLIGFRDMILKSLTAECLAASEGAPLSEVDRRAETVRLKGEINSLERTRERICRDAEAAGMAIARDETADPAILLALNKDL